MKKTFLLLTAAVAFLLPIFSQSNKIDLSVTAEDLYILPGDENGVNKNGTGYHLYIRKKAGMESVMLIDSNKDPAGKQTNYAYRATEYNKINGDEIRYLNGKVLKSETAKYSLIDSTPEINDKFGQCFHIYIPEVIVFGYPWARNGIVNIADGVFLNIRTFSKKYADYTGLFQDNSFNVSKRNQAVGKKTAPVSEKTVKNEKLSAKTSAAIKKELAQNDKSAGNFAEKYESYNSSYISEDEVDLENMSQVPFEEEDLPDFFFDYDEESDENPVDSYVDYDDSQSATDEPEESESADFKEESSEEKAEDVLTLEKDVPATVPFEEEVLPVEEEPEPEPEIEEIPEDERDVLSETPYDEESTPYDPEKIGKIKFEINDSADPVKPFTESMDGVDPYFVERLEQEEAARLAKEAKKDESEESVKVELGNRFITHNIEMLKIEGSKSIPSLYISKTEVTQLAYRMVTGVNPSTNQGDYNPVETVSWYDVIVFCNLLSIRDGLVPCYSINEARNPGAWGDIPRNEKTSWKIECDFSANGYRMLTIQEWEYAAAGGPNKQSGKYAGSNYIDEVAWYSDNSEETTHIVGMKMPNSCGLYDMCGNVTEWCWGNTGSVERPAAVRGGNYTYQKKYCRSDFKDSCQAWYAHFENGIRICRSVE